MVTGKVPPLVDVQDSVEVPDGLVLVSDMLVGVNVQLRFDGSALWDKLTVPLKLPIPPTVIVEPPVVPSLTLTETGLAVTLKSGGSAKVTATV